jgi:hypothetical protein
MIVMKIVHHDKSCSLAHTTSKLNLTVQSGEVYHDDVLMYYYFHNDYLLGCNLKRSSCTFDSDSIKIALSVPETTACAKNVAVHVCEDSETSFKL